MNQVVLTGRLTRDPELRYTSGNNSAVCNFTIAVDRAFTGQSGEREADFIPVVVWNKQAENLFKYQSKGSQVGVVGKIQVRDYEDDKGNKRYITEVLADTIEYLSPKKKEGTEYDAVQNVRRETNPYEDFGNSIKTEVQETFDIQESDLPF